MLNQSLQFAKTRIAPTPSGYLHIGNALSFALTAAIARKAGAKLLLRIDDLDQARVNLDYLEDVFNTLDFLDINWDQGPRNVDDYQNSWSQLHRMGLYSNALKQLKDQRLVFACQCSRSQLQGGVYPGTCRHKAIPLDTPGAAWRLHTDDRVMSIKTLNNGPVTARLPDAMKDFIVKKKDDYPAYQLASFVDDIHFGIDLIIRGNDLYPSTIAQHYLADVLGANVFQNITFYHHPLLMADGDKKLSKSAGATAIKQLRQQGKTPADLYKQIASMINDELPGFESFIKD